jgi:biopolymer transport protein ExbB/TolQ
MDFFTYLYPREYVAQVVVWVQAIGFALWSTALLYFFIRDLRLRRSINNFDVSALRPARGGAGDANLFSGGSEEDRGYGSVSNRFLTYHLSALDASGKNGRPLDVTGLVNNTASGLVSNNTWLKSTLSLFIIVGLLGTLWGLASSLNQLSTMTPDGSQITNETLSLGLNALLSKLGGAFAPSIFGVTFTILGVLLFALYTRAGSIPLVAALERQTITLWGPALIQQSPDAAMLMRDNIKAAEQIGKAAESISTNVDKLVATFNENLPDLVKNLTESIGAISEKLSTEATNLSDDVSNARSSLKALTGASENLNKFSETFKTSVEKLYPFSDATELRSLYEQLLERSTGILENHDAFQQLVLEQLNQIAEQKVLFNQGLSSFSENVNRASGSIVNEIGGTSTAAKDAFSRLSEQNENVIRELVRQVGSPITELLEPIPGTLTVLNQEIRRINTPLEGVKDSIANSSYAVINYATDRMVNIEDKLQAQVTNLEGLTSSVDGLVPKLEILSERIDGFNKKTEKFSDSIADFGGSTAALAGKFERFDQKAEEVIMATRVAPKSPPREPAPPRAPQKKKGFFGGIRSKFFGE